MVTLPQQWVSDYILQQSNCQRLCNRTFLLFTVVCLQSSEQLKALETTIPHPRKAAKSVEVVSKLQDPHHYCYCTKMCFTLIYCSVQL